jgi:hypothetical protein
MRNRALRPPGRHGFLPFTRVCNGLLHTRFLNTHHRYGRCRTQGMKPIGVLL